MQQNVKLGVLCVISKAFGLFVFYIPHCTLFPKSFKCLRHSKLFAVADQKS